MDSLNGYGKMTNFVNNNFYYGFSKDKLMNLLKDLLLLMKK